MDSNIDKLEYISYKKVLLFGAESTGKTCFAKLLKIERFPEKITHTEEG